VTWSLASCRELDLFLAPLEEPRIIFLFCVLFWLLFLHPLFSALSFLIWNSLWLVEELLTLLYVFLIMRMEISEFL
jgi:hypothetical protein